MEDIYLEASGLIREAEAILVCAGAGMGVDSGLPDFRGNKGFWKAYPPYAEKGLQFTDMANPDWFYSDPEFAWGFYGHRLNLYRETKPHNGFNILLKWGESKGKGYFVFTSNVDGQFQKAGFAKDRILEVHGSIHHMQCLNQCEHSIYSGEDVSVRIDANTMQAIPPLPNCPSCSGTIRPNILMFGDWGWDSARQSQQSNLYRDWLSLVGKEKLVVIECGAGTAVPTVRLQSENIASMNENVSVIRINLRESGIRHPHLSITDGVLPSLTKIDALL